jgi:hypothetical protein
VVVLIVVDCRFEPPLGQTKDYNIVVDCWFEPPLGQTKDCNIVVDCWFEPSLGQTKDYNIVIDCMFEPPLGQTKDCIFIVYVYVNLGRSMLFNVVIDLKSIRLQILVSHTVTPSVWWMVRRNLFSFESQAGNFISLKLFSVNNNIS